MYETKTRMVCVHSAQFGRKNKFESKVRRETKWKKQSKKKRYVDVTRSCLKRSIISSNRCWKSFPLLKLLPSRVPFAGNVFSSSFSCDLCAFYLRSSISTYEFRCIRFDFSSIHLQQHKNGWTRAHILFISLNCSHTDSKLGKNKQT